MIIKNHNTEESVFVIAEIATVIKWTFASNLLPVIPKGFITPSIVSMIYS